MWSVADEATKHNYLTLFSKTRDETTPHSPYRQSPIWYFFTPVKYELLLKTTDWALNARIGIPILLLVLSLRLIFFFFFTTT